MRQELHNADRTASGGHASRATLGALASKRARLGVVLAAAVVGILTIAPGAFAATTPLVSTSTSAPTSGTVGAGTALVVNFNEAPVLASSYSLTLADGSDSGTLSTADGNLSATVSGNQITFTALGAPAGGTINLGVPVEILSATGVSDGSGNQWNLAASGQADKPEALSAGDQVVVTYNQAVTVPGDFSLSIAEGSMQAIIGHDSTEDNASASVSGDTVTYTVTNTPDGVVPTDPPTVTNVSGVTPTTASVASTCSSDGTGTGTDPCVYVNVDLNTECSDANLGVTRVFSPTGGTNCDISIASAGDPVAPDVYDVIPVPTDDLPGPNPTNGDPPNDDNAPEVITNCENGSTDTVYDVQTGAELGQNACGNNPPEQALGNTNSNTLDYIPTPNLESFEEAGVVETIPGSTYVSPTAVPPQLSSIDVSGDQATFNYYTSVVCQNNGTSVDGKPDSTVAQFSYTSPYTDENYNDRVWATGIACPSGSPTGSGSNSIVVTYDEGPIPSGVRFKFAGYGPGEFIVGAPGSAFQYEIEASESAYVGPSALITSFTPQSTTLASSAGGTVNVSFATSGALTCTLGAISNPAGAASLTLPSAASCNGSGTISVPANTSDSSPVVYTVTLTADGVSGTPPAHTEITITVPAATAPGLGGSTPPKPSILSLSLLKLLLTKIHNGAKFKFTATSGATGYLCALVRLPSGKKHHALKPHYAFCSASKTYKNLKSGRYELFVKAVGPGLVSKALTKTFTIKDTKTKTKKHHHG